MADWKINYPVRFYSGCITTSMSTSAWYKKDWKPEDLFKDFKDYTPPGGFSEGGQWGQEGSGNGKMPISKENLIPQESDWQEMKWGDKPGTKLSGFYLGITRQNNYYCGVVQDDNGNVQMFSMPTQLHNQIAKLTRHRYVSIAFTGTKRTERGRVMKEFNVEVVKEATQAGAEKELSKYKSEKVKLELVTRLTGHGLEVKGFPNITLGYYYNGYYIHDKNAGDKYLLLDGTLRKTCGIDGVHKTKEDALKAIEKYLSEKDA